MTRIPPDGEDRDRLDQLVGRVFGQLDELRAELSRLRASLEIEIRTRRIVVREDDGFERVVIGAHGRWGGVAVHGRAHRPGSTSAELFANDPVDGDGANVGLSLADAGNVVATFEVLQGRRPALWIAPEPGPGDSASPGESGPG
jgi:hypothetical protein